MLRSDPFAPLTLAVLMMDFWVSVGEHASGDSRLDMVWECLSDPCY